MNAVTRSPFCGIFRIFWDGRGGAFDSSTSTANDSVEAARIWSAYFLSFWGQAHPASILHSERPGGSALYPVGTGTFQVCFLLAS